MTEPIRVKRPNPEALVDELAQILYAYDTEPELDKQKYRRMALGVITEWAPELLSTLLAGVSELADRYQVQANTVAVWTQRHSDFPEPLLQVGGRVRVWWVPDVDQWYNQRKERQ